ncbi:hypothetical protein JTE90_018008 [Oedothorax gibbosus]|uniref:RanBP-type and C3HC4-type zinc finger-containing protein 1 n=1 Tax=Oedothorax gibbosus TaxID=931172 RepID=A0AAV6VA07_9ARAC|nr:hypothetical protein JTE90_018008 [Oedothorax gibbosus]
MEDLDVIFLGHGSLKNFIPPVATEENGQQEPNGHQPIAGFYGNLVTVGRFPQPVQDSEPHHGIRSTSNLNENPSTAFPVPPSTSKEELVTTKQHKNPPEPVPLRRNPDRSVKKVSSPNLIGPNGTYISHPKRSMLKPDEPKKLKIQKVEMICSPPKIKQPKPTPQAPKKQKNQKVERIRSPKIKQPKPTTPQAPKKQKIQKVERVSPKKRIKQLIVRPQAARKQKVEKAATAVAPTQENDPSYQRLLALLDADLVPSTEGANCPVCHFWVPPGNGVVLKNCLHSFCRKCLESAIQKSQTALVKCPFVCKEYECESHLQEREVKSLVSPDDYERHLARSVFQAQCQATNAFHCVMPGCNGWCLVDDIRATWFACPMCMSKNCIPCRAIHNEMGCPKDDGLQFLGMSAHNMENELQKNSEKCSSSVHWKKALLTSQCSEDQPEGYRNLLEIMDMGLVTNTEAFDCPICFSDIAIGEGVTLKECLHNYCRECLTGTIRHSDTVLVKCPFVNDEYSCESFVQEREIKSLLNPDEFERHLAMGLAQVERQSTNSFHCKTPDCAGWCLVEDDANQFFCLVRYICVSFDFSCLLKKDI